MINRTLSIILIIIIFNTKIFEFTLQNNFFIYVSNNQINKIIIFKPNKIKIKKYLIYFKNININNKNQNNKFILNPSLIKLQLTNIILHNNLIYSFFYINKLKKKNKFINFFFIYWIKNNYLFNYLFYFELITYLNNLSKNCFKKINTIITKKLENNCFLLTTKLILVKKQIIVSKTNYLLI